MDDYSTVITEGRLHNGQSKMIFFAKFKHIYVNADVVPQS